MSESINLGQTNISTDIVIIGNVESIKIGLTSLSNRILTNIKRERKTNIKLNIKKANCHSFIKKTLHKEIKNTGTEKKNKDGLWDALSIEKNSKKLKFSLTKSSAHLENLSESEDIEKPKLK